MRRLVDFLRNSYSHFLTATFLEKLEMEGFVISYSQGGEDLVIKKLLHNKRNGFYIDIGCNNPIQKSNTFKLYLKGWQGICVDGNATLVEKFRKIRRRDVCLHHIVSDRQEHLTFYQSDADHEFSTVDTEIGEQLADSKKDIRKLEMQSVTLAQILDQHFRGGEIDLLCIDVEGHDLNILQGNDFDKYRPRLICAETGEGLPGVLQHPITQFLTEKQYHLKACCGQNAYYTDER